MNEKTATDDKTESKEDLTPDNLTSTEKTFQFATCVDKGQRVF